MSTKFRSLAKAAAAGDLGAVESLLSRGSEVDARGGSGRTPLNEAIRGDHTDVALYLVGQGADPEAANRDGFTPLKWATMRSGWVRHRNVKLAEALLDAGAEVNAADADGMTPLMWAANRGSVRLVRLLLARGADVRALTTQEYNSGRNVLVYADGLAVVRVLLDAGADPNAVDENGMRTWEFHRGAGARLLRERAGGG